MTPLHQQTVEAAEIAEALGYTASYFPRIVSTLIDVHGMPPRLPGKKRWSRAAIEHWLQRYQGAAAPSIIEPAGDLPADIAAQRLLLQQAYGEGARA